MHITYDAGEKKYVFTRAFRSNKNLWLIHCFDIMQKNTKVTVKLMKLPAHNVWCLPSLSHESDRYCGAKKKLSHSVFSALPALKRRRAPIGQSRATRDLISLITLVTSVMRISGPSMPRRGLSERIPKEFSRRKLRPLPPAMAEGRRCEIYFCCLWDSRRQRRDVVGSLSRRLLPSSPVPLNCDITYAEDAPRSIEKSTVCRTYCSATSFQFTIFSSSLGNTRT